MKHITVKEFLEYFDDNTTIVVQETVRKSFGKKDNDGKPIYCYIYEPKIYTKYDYAKICDDLEVIGVWAAGENKIGLYTQYIFDNDKENE